MADARNSGAFAKAWPRPDCIVDLCGENDGGGNGEGNDEPVTAHGVVSKVMAQQEAKDALADDIVALVASTACVSQERARELLEAVGGCPERATDLHFSQVEGGIAMAPSAGPPAAVNPKAVLGQPELPPAPSSAKRFLFLAGKSAAKRSRSISPGGATQVSPCTAETGLPTEAGPNGPVAPSTARVGDIVAPIPHEGGTTLQGVAQAPTVLGAGVAVDAAVAGSSSSSAPSALEYRHLTTAFAKLCGTSKRKEKDAILLDMFRKILAEAPEDLVPAVYLSSNKLGPPWEDLDMGVGGSAITAAIKAATGASPAEMSSLWKQCGDAGDVAAEVRSRQTLLMRPPVLTVRKVYEDLLSLCAMSGEGCAARKVSKLAGLIRAARDPEETRFLVRTFACHIRTQATLTTVKDAAVAAIVEYRARRGAAGDDGTVADVQLAARACFTACPDVRRVLEPLLHEGVHGMRRSCAFAVGTPMRPMLARAETSVEGVLSSSGGEGVAIACEHKYDGQRAQIHRDAGARVRIFSRHLEDMTDKFPDVVDALSSACVGAEGEPLAFVLDAEIVAVSPASVGRADIGEEQAAAQKRNAGAPALRSDAFQRLSTRKRKDVTVGTIEVAVKVFAFDLLFLGCESTIHLPFIERRRILHEAFQRTSAFDFAEFTDVPATSVGALALEGAVLSRQDRVQEALERALADNCEGLMCKTLSAPYEPSDGSKRSTAWLKLKADYIEGMGDSLDLVPIGGWHGMGRKAKWISPFLLACWDPETETLQSLCRVLSGFTDAFYTEKTAFYLGGGDTTLSVAGDRADVEGEDVTDQDAGDAGGAGVGAHSRPIRDPRVRTGESPPMWFQPCEVWEIRGASFSLSPKHKAAAGLVHPERGLGLRFPRFIRPRPDKRIEEATTSAQLAEMFRRQQVGGLPRVAPRGERRSSGQGGEEACGAGSEASACEEAGDD